MKRLLLIFLLAVPLCSLYAQSKSLTIVLLRHAEKANDGTKDPGLSPAGTAFAKKLTQVFRETKVDAIYSTGYKRTIETVLPLAEKNQLKVITYEAGKSAGLLKEILAEQPGLGTIVIAGHSNTVDQIFNSVITAQPIKALEEKEYNKVFILSYDPENPGKSSFIKLDLN